MGIKDHLTTTEEIVGNISCARGVKYYVTNKRVIRYLQTATREEMDDLLCKHITSISLVSKIRRGLIWGGIALFAIGAIALALLVTLKNIGWTSNFSYICYASMVLGLILTICGFRFKIAYYQFIAAGISGDIAGRWRIVGVSAEAARKFILLVRESV